MKYDVKAVALDSNGVMVADPRIERIDTVTNALFKGAKHPWDVEDRFVEFWNRLNPATPYSLREKVVVLSVVPV